ncbi:MAG: hypothetical protein ABIJ45_01790 [Candidatus Zixiibacteriota bacterium]
MNLYRLIYALATLFLPLTYATKIMIGYPQMIWINPTALLALFLFIAVLPRIEPKISFYIIISSIISACIGFVFLSPAGGIGGALYAIAKEPIRTGLNLIWFWVSLKMLKDDREFVVKWLTVSVSIQLFIAFYLWFGIVGYVPLPSQLMDYLQTYALAQIIWFNETPIIRLTGTFTEGPPFGLFMFASFVIFSLLFYKEKVRGRYIKVGLIVSFIGVIGSLAMQVLVGLAVYTGFGLIFAVKGRKSRSVKIAAVILMLVLIPFLIGQFMARFENMSSLRAHDAYGKGMGERVYHSIYAAELIVDNPEYLPFGIGPGRYGEYVAKTGAFPPTVTPQVTLIDWLIEFGLFGFVLIAWWLWLVGRRSWEIYGSFGLAAFIGLITANMFQGNWQWESWFLALAFLYFNKKFRSN